MIKAIISLVVMIVMVYFLITAVQRYYEGQEEIRQAEEALKTAQDEHDKNMREFKAIYLEYYNCTYVNEDEYSCPPGTPDFETYCDPSKATFDREVCRGTKIPG
jgi:hypothetical protein